MLITIHKQTDQEKMQFQNEKMCQGISFIQIVSIKTFYINLVLKNCNIVLPRYQINYDSNTIKL